MKYVVQKPIAWGGRKEKGAVVEMSEVDAKNIGVPEYLVEENAKPAQTETVDEVSLDNLEEKTVEELKSIASEMGLKVSGTKSDLIERITLASDTPEESEEEETEEA